MRKISAVIAAVILGAISFLHILWGIGIYWPAEDLDGFRYMFFGEQGPLPALWTGILMAIAWLAGAAVLLRKAWEKPLPLPGWFWTSGLMLFFGVFFLRGILGYMQPIAGTLEPYITLNKYIYSPLCFVLAFSGFLGIYSFKRKK